MSIESGHYYTPAGEPAHFVPCKSRPGENRPTTISDAKKMGLYPSVTQVLRVLDKPALTKWLVTQAVHAVVTAPDVPGESLDAKLVRVLETEKQQDEQSQRARDLGVDIHAAIESAVCLKPWEPSLTPFVTAATAQLAELGSVVASEKILVHPMGFAGKTDCITDGDIITVVDFKTCSKLPKTCAWPEARLQVSAYAASLGNTGDKRIQGAVLYVSTTEPGKTALFLEPDWQQTFEIFKSVFAVWTWMNSYQPKPL